MKPAPITKGDRIRVRPLMSKADRWGTFDHLDSGGRLVYLPDGSKANMGRTGWVDVLEAQPKP